MTERRLTAVALVVIAAALVANLVGHTERTVEAAGDPSGRTLLELQAHRHKTASLWRLFRVWSDGTIETRVLRFKSPFSAENDPVNTSNWCDLDDYHALAPCALQPSETSQ